MRWILLGSLVLMACLCLGQEKAWIPVKHSAAVKARSFLIEKYGKTEEARILQGMDQVRVRWRPEDGHPTEFTEFVQAEFLPLGKARDATFQRMEAVLESIDGHLYSIARELRRGQDLDLGDTLPIDYRLAGMEPSAHVSEDLFRSKVAFSVLLNFPVTTLETRLAEGGKWTRRQWAEARLAQRFAVRASSATAERIGKAYSAAQAYVSSYNIYTHNLLTDDGRRLFAKGQRLLSHWNLRDEIKALYSDPKGIEKQRLLATVMERIVRQEIPANVINSDKNDWTPDKVDAKAREKDERYRHWLGVFKAERSADGQDPMYPTYLDRRFARDSEMPEKEVERLILEVLDAPVVSRALTIIQNRLGRKLEPFDIFYPGFASSEQVMSGELDGKTKSLYPNPAAFTKDLSRILTALGFSMTKTAFLTERIVVEPARGSGHAMGFMRRDDKAHLRTRFEPGGMDYKGYNIAIHELGHNVEQVFSTATIDHMSLRGVPNVAFTEALAFVFQARDREVLGVGTRGSSVEHALNEFWEARQMAGMALVDLRAWRWLYANPDCTPNGFAAAVQKIAEEVWQKWYEPYLGVKHCVLLGIYSHMVDSGLYLPDYLLARLIAFQIEAHFAKVPGPMGTEFERLAKLGYLTPDAWMRQAVGAGVSAEPLLRAVEKA